MPLRTSSFPASPATTSTRPGVRERFYVLQAEVGIQPRRTMHQLRHTFATVCASHGIPLRTIQGWCGHEDHSTTERYAHFMPRHEDAALVSAAFAPVTAPLPDATIGTDWWRSSARPVAPRAAHAAGHY